MVARDHDDTNSRLSTFMQRTANVGAQRIGQADEAEQLELKALRCIWKLVLVVSPACHGEYSQTLLSMRRHAGEHAGS
jgi:hypothetical protein